jgi:hypothetical protein
MTRGSSPSTDVGAFDVCGSLFRNLESYHPPSVFATWSVKESVISGVVVIQ